ncbi:transposase [Acetoanaerobium noterae]|uniref:transposase n=1 Tax=Acetoanaerobium noterae TaxID=745369 RepID=UPI003AB95633
MAELIEGSVYIVRAYNKRGNRENFIKEAMMDFFMDTSSNSSLTANKAKMLIKAFVYNIINIMKNIECF